MRPKKPGQQLFGAIALLVIFLIDRMVSLTEEGGTVHLIEFVVQVFPVGVVPENSLLWNYLSSQRLCEELGYAPYPYCTFVHY